MKLLACKAGLPGDEVSFLNVPPSPANKAGFEGALAGQQNLGALFVLP
jgi:hypothetical protein